VPTSLSLERGSRLRHPSWPGPVPAPAPALRLGAGSVVRVADATGSKTLERRGSVRIQVPQLLSVRPVDHDASYAIVGQLLDLSLGGCALRTRQRLEVGTRVVVTTDAGCVPLQLIGEIVRVWRTGSSGWCHAGIQFDAMPPRARDTINRYFAEHLRRTSSS
jgi:c-di-GMP-binding flagellar brake protein YcgR